MTEEKINQTITDIKKKAIEDEELDQIAGGRCENNACSGDVTFCF